MGLTQSRTWLVSTLTTYWRAHPKAIGFGVAGLGALAALKWVRLRKAQILDLFPSVGLTLKCHFVVHIDSDVNPLFSCLLGNKYTQL